MQCFDNESLYTVTITTREIAAFRPQWPCAHLRDRPLTFTFRKATGDLVDSNDARQHPDADGGAIMALANDAMIYGAIRLNLADVLDIRAREHADYLTSH